MKSAEIRESFLKYFEAHNHTRVPSSGLIPAADPTLLFTNAGMVQFKDCFLGIHDPGYCRATTAQKCVRAGGKHNDLENVGFTPRHHTFFEMMGNFSFGDYFKKEAIAFAWEYLTEVVQLPKEKLRITVFRDDDEAEALWKAQGIRSDWIVRLGEKDNFWAMGDTGPCGPCSEIYFDFGESYGPVMSDSEPGFNDKRFLEIWNLVFMQFDRDSSGTFTPLPKPSVDTGAGLERLSAVLQGVYSNYDTDLFVPLIQAIGKRVGVDPQAASEKQKVSMRVIADHLRSGCFLMADGVNPSNEGRGYVLRRILRRAIRHGKNLGQEKPFLFDLIPALKESLGSFYPELNGDLIPVLMKEEEQRFHETLHRGMGVLEDAIAKSKQSGGKQLSGEVAFKLYDTFGFPLDLVEVICQEENLNVDQKGFDECMREQRSKSVWQGGKSGEAIEKITKALTEKNLETIFLGYETLSSTSKVMMLFDAKGNSVDALQGAGYLVVDKTPFYAESGGQVGDVGDLGPAGQVHDTTKVNKAFVHHVEAQLKVGDQVALHVDQAMRQRTAVNHTATHLLHAALRKVLGDRVKQAGSRVDPDRLRFDFTFPRGLKPEEIREVESLANAQVARSLGVSIQELPYDEAVKSGAMAFFDEKYGDRVRVISVGGEEPFSVELCGGTHLKNSNEIGLIKILTESSVASGVRRIEALTSQKALDYLLSRHQVLSEIEGRLGTHGERTSERVNQLVGEVKELGKQNEALKIKVAQAGARGGDSAGGALWDKKVDIAGLQVVMEQVSEANPKILRTLVDQVRDKLKEKTLVCLAAASGDKATLCLGVTKDIQSIYRAKDVIQVLAKEVSGSGGGRDDFAQAGGTDPAGIPRVFERLKSYLNEAG